MKCTNTNFKCNGEMKPLFKSPNLTECVKCGFRIDTPYPTSPFGGKLREGGVVEGTVAETITPNKKSKQILESITKETN